MVPKQPPPNFFAPYPASNPRSKLFIFNQNFIECLNLYTMLKKLSLARKCGDTSTNAI